MTNTERVNEMEKGYKGKYRLSEGMQFGGDVVGPDGLELLVKKTGYGWMTCYVSGHIRRNGLNAVPDKITWGSPVATYVMNNGERVER